MLFKNKLITIALIPPSVKKKHAEYVPHEMSEGDFWTRFFQSHYFHRDRTAHSSKDLFSDCAKKDEEGTLSPTLTSTL